MFRVLIAACFLSLSYVQAQVAQIQDLRESNQLIGTAILRPMGAISRFTVKGNFPIIPWTGAFGASPVESHQDYPFFYSSKNCVVFGKENVLTNRVLNQGEKYSLSNIYVPAAGRVTLELWSLLTRPQNIFVECKAYPYDSLASLQRKLAGLFKIEL